MSESFTIRSSKENTNSLIELYAEAPLERREYLSLLSVFVFKVAVGYDLDSSKAFRLGVFTTRLGFLSYVRFQIKIGQSVKPVDREELETGYSFEKTLPDGFVA